MRPVTRVVPALLALLLLSGCAKTSVTERQGYEGPPLARPDRIIVYDFAANASDLPAGYDLAVAVGPPSTPPTANNVELGRKLGAEVAKDLVTELQTAGLPAVGAAGQPAPRIGDLTIVGYFVSVDSGSIAKRMALGFGSGAAELSTVVEVYLMTDRGLRRLGSGELKSTGPKTPGEALPLAVTVATGNPIGLIVSSAMKIGGEVSGMSTVEGSAKRTAKEIADQLKAAAQRQGWI